MAIKKLVKVIPPPKSPLDSEGNWRSAEIVVGIKFPPDFQALISEYGSGAFFQGYLTIFNPLTLEGLALMKQAENCHRSYRTLAYSPLQLPVHPNKPGLLAWGGDDNGNDYCWFTKGNSEKWPVVFLPHGSEGHPVELRTNVTGFWPATPRISSRRSLDRKTHLPSKIRSSRRDALRRRSPRSC